MMVSRLGQLRYPILCGWASCSFAEFDVRLVGPSQERQSSDGASNCVEASTRLSGSVSDFDFVNRDGFKIESSADGSSSLDRISEPENGF